VSSGLVYRAKPAAESRLFTTSLLTHPTSYQVAKCRTSYSYWFGRPLERDIGILPTRNVDITFWFFAVHPLPVCRTSDPCPLFFLCTPLSFPFASSVPDKLSQHAGFTLS